MRALPAGVALAGVLLAGGLSCGTFHAGLQVDPGPVSSVYAEALREHTRTAWRTEGPHRRVRLTATLHTRAFLDARHGEQAARLGLPAAEVRDVPRDLPLDLPGIGVLVFIEAEEPAWQRLDRRDPVWTFHLQADGARYAPAEIRRVDERDPAVRHLYPYVNRFGRAWLLVFPVDEVGDAPILIMSGAPASFRLAF